MIKFSILYLFTDKQSKSSCTFIRATLILNLKTTTVNSFLFSTLLSRIIKTQDFACLLRRDVHMQYTQTAQSIHLLSLYARNLQSVLTISSTVQDLLPVFFQLIDDESVACSFILIVLSFIVHLSLSSTCLTIARNLH